MTQKEMIDLLESNSLVVKHQVYQKENDREIRDITYNSKECKEGSAFFVKGKNFKVDYIKDAISNGAFIIISEQEYKDIDCGYIIVNDIRRAMAVVALEFFGRAYKAFNLIGLTGTKGKTTTTYFIKNILDAYLKKQSAVISTVGTYTGIREMESHLTTPEAIELQRYFSEIKQSGISFCTMEVTSQAYKTDRVYDMHFNTGVFLNISEDHISDAEHPNFNDYLNCKLEFVKNTDHMIINYETDYYEAVLDAAKNAKKIITYGTDKSKDKADYYIDNIEKLPQGFKFDVHKTEYGKEVYFHTFEIGMQGRFNIENALAAIIVAKLYDVDDNSIEIGLKKTTVEGRMNVFSKNGITVIVDYAHNKLSFTKFFESVSLDYPGSRIITVAGGPGGKAYARRKDLGTIAGKYSSYMYLTAEDPQFENVVDICKEIQSYVTCDYEIIEDRKEAVEKAINNAKPGDVIALLAKGEETYQKVKGVFVPFESDLAIAKRMMQ